MQTTTEKPARSRGLFRRFLGQDRSADPELPPTPGPEVPRPAVMDVRPTHEVDPPATDVRLDRLEAGLRLIVETMKRTYAELSSSIDTLAGQLDVADARGMVERIVAEEVGPLTTSVRELADVVNRIPHTLAAAMEDLGTRIDSGRWKLERSLNDGLEDLRQLAANRTASKNEETPLAPRPFELEPVEEQFAERSGGD